MFNEAHYYKPSNMFPDCHKHAGGGVWFSELCVCFMSDGTFQLCTYLIDEDYSSNDKWNFSGDLSVVAWMEL